MNPILDNLRAPLLSALGVARGRFGDLPAESLASVVVAAGEVGPGLFAALPEGAIRWERPDAALRLLGLGCAFSRREAGGQRLIRLREAWRELRAAWPVWRAEGVVGEPLAFVAFAFDPEAGMEGGWSGFPNSLLTVPELLVREQGGAATLTLSFSAGALADPERLVDRWLALMGEALGPVEGGCGVVAAEPRLLGSAPGYEAWRTRVEEALEAIGRGELEKVVMTRGIDLELPDGVVPVAALGRLERLYPGCALVAACFNGATLLAATPERLASLSGGVLRSDVLAGSEPVGVSRALMASRKERHEHELVRSYVAERLDPLCDHLTIPLLPEVMELHGIRHLHTPVEGHLKGEYSLLDVAMALHPTPAVCGAPAEAAQAWLREAGEVQRGWYTGALGWLDGMGEGELSVLLRCALTRPLGARLYGGAGIVAGSEPRQEWFETELKMVAMRDALVGEPRGAPVHGRIRVG